MKKFLLCAVIAILGCCLFSSCEKEGSWAESKLVGKWYTEYRNSNSYGTMTLGKDGSYNYTHSSGQYRKGYYIYSPKSKTLYVDIEAIPHNNGAYSRTYIIEKLTSSELVLFNTNEASLEYWHR